MTPERSLPLTFLTFFTRNVPIRSLIVVVLDRQLLVMKVFDQKQIKIGNKLQLKPENRERGSRGKREEKSTSFPLLSRIPVN